MAETQQNYEEQVSLVKEGIIADVNQFNTDVQNNPENINNFNELMNKEFLNKLDPSTAEKIVDTIDNLAVQLKEIRKDLPKDLKDLKDFLDPMVNKNKIKGFNEELNPMLSNDPHNNIDKNDKKTINSISDRITKLKGKLNEDKELNDILDKINTYINNLSDATEDLLKQFLVNNEITNSKDKINSTSELLQGIQLFLRNIEQHVKDKEEQGKVIDKLDNNKTRFDNFFKEIDGGHWENLDDFKNEKAREEIKAFINQNPRNENVIKTYILMKKQDQEKVGDGSNDRKVFRDVFECLDNLYGKDKSYRDNAAEYYWNDTLGRVFNSFENNIIKFATDGLKLNDWKGDNLEDGGAYNTEIQKACNTLQGQNFDFDAKYFIENFNKRNDERIKNNADLLGKVDITTKIDLSNVTYDKENDNLYLQKDGKDPELLTKDNLSTELGITDGTIGEVEGTSFVKGEMNNMISTNEDIKDTWLKQIIDKKKSEIPTNDGEGENGNEVETPDPKLTIDENDIKISLKYGVKPDKIAEVINGLNAETKTEKAERITKVIEALQKADTISGSSGNISIQNLQNDMYTALQKEGKMTKKLVADGKFGPKTLYAMRLYVGAKVDNKDKLNYEVSRGRLSERQQGIYDTYANGGDVTSLLGINEGDDPFNALMEELDTSPSGCRKELGKIVENKNFPGKDIIAGKDGTKGLLQDHSKLKSIQLQLVPYYTGHIDGLIGPLTVNAVENYIKGNDKQQDASQNGGDIEKKSDANLVRLDDSGASTTGSDIETVIDKDNSHAYFLEGDDFEYTENGTEIKVTIKTIAGTEEYVYNSNGDILSKTSDSSWVYDQSDKKQKKLHDNIINVQTNN